MIRIGCCGFPVNRELYYQTFNCCEVQITFYTFPNLSLLEKWRKEAPAHFSFLIKASQVITHPASSPTYKRFKRDSFPLRFFVEEKFGLFQLSNEVKTAWVETKKIAEALKSKVVLFQTPPSFSEEKKSLENLYSFFSKIERNDLTLAWEPRGKWEDETLRKISKELKLVLVFDPMVKPPIPGLFQKKGKFPCAFYFRLHGGKGYRHRFAKEELARIAQEAISHKDGYILFNNINMFQDAKKMKEIIKNYERRGENKR